MGWTNRDSDTTDSDTTDSDTTDSDTTDSDSDTDSDTTDNGRDGEGRGTGAMIRLRRKALPLLLPLLALVLSTLPPMTGRPSHAAPAVTTAIAATRPTPPRPRHGEMPPPDFVPAPLRAAVAAARLPLAPRGGAPLPARPLRRAT